MTEIHPLPALSYLVSIVFFILGLKNMGSAKTAAKGNRYSAIAMLIAVCTALIDAQIMNPYWIIGGLGLGAIIGLILALKVEMTQMPELVAILNGFGGMASALVALGVTLPQIDQDLGGIKALIIAFTIIVGLVTFTGSVIAFGKLSGKISSSPFVYPGQKIVNLCLLILLMSSMGYFAVDTQFETLFVMVVAASLFGILLVIPIGGADMPVVISLLNSYSGIAASATGFVFNNYVLIVSGALVGASGLVLTKIMCEAMNRSLTNVLFGAFGDSAKVKEQFNKKTVRGYTVDDVVIQLENAASVVIVPGYGLAVAQAQHNIRELEELLNSHNISVKYAIHPVAGRMPGHMNVLLAEAKIDYDRQIEMDDINPEFESTDVVLVIGANDVTNPAARNDKTSPIYGMPILNVDKAKTCIVLKRSLSPGFAGIDNELFYSDKTMMIFGDAKKTVVELVNKIKTEF